MKKISFVGLGCMVFAFCIFVWLNLPTMFGKTVKFESTYKENQVTLQATLYEAMGAEYGVLICPGYSCDRQKWRPFANLFVANGMTTMVFDYAGQGASTGTIGFDNAKTDNIPLEISDAITAFCETTGILEEHIILVGHSMGGRSILRLLYDYQNPEADTQVPYQRIRNVILLSPEVNYQENTQANLFAGTTDAVEEPWKSYQAYYGKEANLYIFGSTADDIVKDEDIWSIYKHLGGDTNQVSGTGNSTTVTEYGNQVKAQVVSGVLHSYQMYSHQFADLVNQALGEITGSKELPYKAYHFHFVYLGWGLSLIGIFLFFLGVNGREQDLEELLPSVQDTKAFLIRKLWLWIPGILMAFVVCCVCVIMPFGSPVMNIPYMCFISGYGLLMLFLYKKGWMKGVEGTLPRPTLKFVGEKRKGVSSGVVTVLVCFFAWYVLRATMYRLIPLNWRLFWLVFATALMTVGYYISGVESDMLKKNTSNKGCMFLYSLIQYIPLFLFVLFYLVIKSYSGLIGQIINVVLMYILCIPVGDYVRNRTGNRMLGAVLTAFLFQTLMITSAALIAFL